MNRTILVSKWNEVWQYVKSCAETDSSQVDAFFVLLQPQAISDGFLMLTTTSPFVKKWIDQHYLDLIKKALFDLNGIPFTVLVEVDSSTDPSLSSPVSSPSPSPSSSPSSSPSPTALSSTLSGGSAEGTTPLGSESALSSGSSLDPLPSVISDDLSPSPHDSSDADPSNIPLSTSASSDVASMNAGGSYTSPGSFPGSFSNSSTSHSVNPSASSPAHEIPSHADMPHGSSTDATSPNVFSSNASSATSSTPASLSSPTTPAISANSVLTDNSPVPTQLQSSEASASSSPTSSSAVSNPTRTPHTPAFHSQSYQAAYESFDTSYDRYSAGDGRDPLSGDTSQTHAGSLQGGAAGGFHGPSSPLTFENFVIGDSNRMAYSMAVTVADQPGESPLNPLFIYGKSGLGKTHLMRAIQNYINLTQPQLSTIYVDSADLLSDYMDASAAHDKEKSSYKTFKNKYEETDVLLIDDIQFLQGKKQTLDIVFQIFNKLISRGRQIVLSADRAPKNIDIDERYHSRFNQGGTIDIQPPEVETKLGIVRSFIDEYKNNEALPNFAVPKDIQMYIAENSSSNIRELKSAVTKVIYQMTFFDQPNMTVPDVRVLLENHFSGGSSRNLTVEDIQHAVEEFFKIKHSDLVGQKRTRNILYPRQVAMYLCRQLLDLPFNDIGRKFNRDHSTVLHSVANVEKMMRNSREVQEEIETLKQIIRDL